MLEELQGHLEAMRELVGGVEPATLCPEDARRLLEVAAGVERLGLGLKLAVAPRALVDAPWSVQGYASEAAWLAEQLRSSVPEAIGVKERAEALAQLPALARASRGGSLSSAEVTALSAAASADPSAQDELLEAAGTLGVHEVLRYSRILARAAHESDPGHLRRLSQKRFLRFWTDPEGLVRFSGGVVEDEGLELLSSVRAMAEHLRSEVARATEPDPGDKALAADALVSLVRGDRRWASFDGPGAQLAARPDVMIVVAPDTEAPAGAGQLCHLPGVGPVSLR
ncbi:MAG TPA: hypothetical protein VK386_08610, partial [Acidimicrobiales bacterium]|nr:hypothetical protein [Acidimicrobiales bacterium]